MPGPEVAVAFTVSGQREKYLRETLDSWLLARGVQDTHLVFCIEPDPRFPVGPFREWCQRSFTHSSVIVNDHQRGCLDNTRAAADAGFATGARFVIVAEEDIAVSTDTLEYFAWAQRYEHDENVAAVCAHTFRAPGKVPAHIAVQVCWFSPLVWGTWRDDWEKFIRPRWGSTPGNDQAWDLHLRLEVQKAGKRSVFPARSRSQHFGNLSSITTPVLSEFFYAGSLSNCYSPRYDPQPWAEVTEGIGELDLIV